MSERYKFQIVKKMKRGVLNYLIIAAILVLPALISCSKEKVQLLDTITYDDGSYTKYEYDNENRVTKISRYDKDGNENIGPTQTFFYSGNDLVKVALNSDSDSSFNLSLEFSKSENKIVVAIKNSNSDNVETASLYLDNDGLPAKYESETASDVVTSSMVGTFEFHDGNLTKYSYKQTQDSIETLEGSLNFKYDNMKSPLYHCKTPRWWWFILENKSVQNNEIEMSNDNGEKVEYKYEFDSAGYPTKCTIKNSEGEYVSEFKYK